MTILAGTFLFLFGGLTSWLLAARYPNARFMRLGYLLMALGGALFVIWTLSHQIAFGLLALAVLLVGGTLGVLGAIRKELRLTP